MTLRDFILSVLSGSIALGPVLYLLFDRVERLRAIQPENKRIAVAAVAALLGLAVWGLAVWLGYVPTPAGRQEWADAIFQHGLTAGFAAYMSAEVIHSRRELPGTVRIK